MKKNKMRILALAIVLVMSLAMIAACGSPGEPTPAPEAPTPEAPAPEVEAPTPEAEAPTPAPEAEAPAAEDDSRRGGILRFATHMYSSSPGHPASLGGMAHFLYTALAHETLVMYDENANFVPLLATDWDIDPDEPSITWHLRQGVRFSDGAPFNADAVRANVEEYARVGRIEASDVADFEIIDDYTIKMILHDWSTAAFERIGNLIWHVSPAALEDLDLLGRTSVGTGPFIVTEFEPGVRTIYTRNPDYWREGYPLLDGVEMHMVVEATTRIAAFEAGEFDIVFLNTLSLMPQLRANPDFTMLYNQTGPGYIGFGLIPNSLPGSPFEDVRVRQAFAYAIDEQAIANAFGFGLVESSNQWAFPGSPNFNPNVVGFPQNIDRARELMAEAGFADGFDTTISLTPDHADIATAAQSMLAEVGIRAEIILIDHVAQSGMMNTGWEGIMVHFHGLTPNLGVMMGNHLRGAFYNHGMSIPDEVFDALDRILSARTGAERTAYEHEMQALIYDDLMIFGKPFFIQLECAFKQPWVHDDNFAQGNVFLWDSWRTWLDR